METIIFSEKGKLNYFSNVDTGVNPSCLKDINTINKKSNVKGSELMKLRTNGQDIYSSMKLSELELMFTPRTISKIYDKVKYQENRAISMRWILRGLKLEYAIHIGIRRDLKLRRKEMQTSTSVTTNSNKTKINHNSSQDSSSDWKLSDEEIEDLSVNIASYELRKEKRIKKKNKINIIPETEPSAIEDNTKESTITESKSKYKSVNVKCLSYIHKLNTAKNVSEEELTKLITHGPDCVSALKEEVLMNDLDKTVIYSIISSLPYKKDQLAAMRWCKRGLRVDLAIRKQAKYSYRSC